MDPHKHRFYSSQVVPYPAKDKDFTPGWIFTMMRNLSKMYAENNPVEFPISDFEDDIRGLWVMIIEAAKHLEPNQEGHLRILYTLQYHKQIGTLYRTREPDRKGQSVVEAASTSDGSMWADLPFLARDLKSAWANNNQWTSEQRIKYAGFLGQVHSLGIIDLSDWAFTLIRDTLEANQECLPRSEGPETSISGLLPAMAGLMKFCGWKLAASIKSSSGVPVTFDLNPGNHAMAIGHDSDRIDQKRWLFWLDRLREFGSDDDPEIARAANDSLRSMTTDWIASTYLHASMKAEETGDVSS